MATQETNAQGSCGTVVRGRGLWGLLIGLGLGVVLTAGAVWTFMPGMMLQVRRSELSFDETVSRIQEAIPRQGWIVTGTRDMQKSLAKHGRTLDRRVKIIELCQADYASEILAGHRELSAMMPCAIAVYEGDDGRTYVSKMDTGLMGRMFGGKVAEIMGRSVARDEKAILSSVFGEG